MKQTRTRPFVRKIDVPIYNVTLIVGVAEDLAKLAERLSPIFGDQDTTDAGAACCWSGEQQFAVLFGRAQLDVRNIEMIGHEVFHLTHRILQWSDVKFGEEDHEAAALLHGYLLDTVVGMILRNRK